MLHDCPFYVIKFVTFQLHSTLRDILVMISLLRRKFYTFPKSVNCKRQFNKFIIKSRASLEPNNYKQTNLYDFFHEVYLITHN